MLEHLELQDVGFTGVLDSALKWVIKNKAKCIDELQEVDVVKTRLDKIKDALVTEKNEEAAAVAVGAATSDDPPDEAADEAIRCANPAKYAEHGVEYWQAYAAQTVKTYIRLAPEPRTQAGLAQLIEGSHVNMCKGLEQKNAVLILLDLDLLCESVTRPMDRRPVLPDGIVQRLLRGSMQGRGAQKNKDDEYCQPVAGDVYFLLDGKREHLHKTLLEAFCPSGKKAGLTDCSVRVFNLFLSEQSLRARKAIVRGSDPISQRQCMLCVTASPLVPTRSLRRPTRSIKAPTVVTSSASSTCLHWRVHGSFPFPRRRRSTLTGLSQGTRRTRTPAPSTGMTPWSPPSTTSCRNCSSRICM